jgi:hypothetical protein
MFCAVEATVKAAGSAVPNRKPPRLDGIRLVEFHEISDMRGSFVAEIYSNLSACMPESPVIFGHWTATDRIAAASAWMKESPKV